MPAAKLSISPPRVRLMVELSRTEEARHAYRRALALAQDGAEQRLLERRLAEL